MQAFAKRMRDLFGEPGSQWVAGLPALLSALADKWQLTVGPPFDVSYNYVASATMADGTPVVLKVGYPRPEQLAEAMALRHYAGRACVQILAHDAARGAMLLERLSPGLPLAAIADDDTTNIAAGVMADLWRPPPAGHRFPTSQDWMQGLTRLRLHYAGGTGPFPEPLVDKAERLSLELHASAEPAVLLHGDLHHYNILSAKRARWLAIDPQGVIGEPCYEVGALLRNPLPQVYGWPDFAARTSRRVALLSERLGFDRRRIAGWGLAQAVLSAWWTVEDHGRFNAPELRLAEVLAPII